jgi:hypothetical protein
MIMVKNLISFLLIFLFAYNSYAQSIPIDAIKVILGEAENQGSKGMQAVAEVYRRKADVNFFSSYKDMKGINNEYYRKKRRIENKYVKQAKQAWVLSQNSDITKGATLFENIKAFGFPKSWAKDKVIETVTIKDHVFYREIK